jgi:hypothetical protein
MKSRIVVAIAMGVFVCSLGYTVLGAAGDEERGRGHDRGGSDELRARIGLAYAQEQGITLKYNRRDRSTVGLGSYLVNAVGGCNDCHTAPPFTQDPFAFLGAPKQINLPCYLAGGQVFGPFVSRDITPWEDGKPAGLTFEEFKHVMRTGEDPDNPGQVLHVMPWPVYQTMSTEDLRAVYTYLRSIPPIPANTCGAPSE